MRRLIDIVASALLLTALGPLFLLLAIAIWIDDPGAVFFTQARAGRLAYPFRLLKFRSMKVNDFSVCTLGKVEAHHPLVNRLGGMLRRYKLDELPQLLNVLRGDMSLIGPRPTVFEQVNAYTPFQQRRLHMRPGMTGWAQVNGGIEIEWPERIMLDVWYIEHRSLALDMRILVKTLAVIFLGERPNPEALRQAREYACNDPSANAIATESALSVASR